MKNITITPADATTDHIDGKALAGPFGAEFKAAFEASVDKYNIQYKELRVEFFLCRQAGAKVKKEK